jgi:hypothetical protein
MLIEPRNAKLLKGIDVPRELVLGVGCAGVRTVRNEGGLTGAYIPASL